MGYLLRQRKVALKFESRDSKWSLSLRLYVNIWFDKILVFITKCVSEHIYTSYYYNPCQRCSLYGSDLYLLVLSPDGLSVKMLWLGCWLVVHKSHLQYAQRKQSTIGLLVNKGSPLLSTAAKRNVFKGNLHFYSKGERLCHTIHSLKFLRPKPQPYGHHYWKLTSGEPFLPDPSPPVWVEVDKEDSMPKNGKALWDNRIFPVLMKHSCILINTHVYW